MFAIAVCALTVLALPGADALNDAPPVPSTVRGTVLDPSHAPVVAAQVTATWEDGRPSGSTVTDARGTFTLTLPSGRHKLTIEAAGFVPLSQTLALPTPSTDAREFVLKIAGVSEVVDVTAASGYSVPLLSSATRTATPLRDIPQSITVVTSELIKDQLMTSMGDVVRYVPGITAHQGENNRDQLIVRGNSSSADFFVDGVRDDVQYYRDLYNLERVEAIKGPNAMIFGRGGAGGVINRVTKTAEFRPLYEVSVQAGAHDQKRIAADADRPLGDKVALRVNGMYEHSGSFRDAVSLDRYGVTPTVTLVPDSNTRITLRYEHLHDTRVADRGITSFRDRPADVDIATYFGNPDASRVRARVNLGSAGLERRFGAITLRNHTLYGDYDRFYQNFVPGAVTSDARQVSISAYNNATARRNLFNQTDLTYAAWTGRLRHTLLAGGELGHQVTDNFRNTGYFGNTAVSILAPLTSPRITTPVTFRQSATDADNHVLANVAAVYGQDQIDVSRHIQVVGGLRFDRFALQYHNNRNGDTLQRPDHLVSPRAGVVYKPIAPVSIYTSYSVSYLPSSGDQFSSLTSVTQQLKPEKFNNYEVGAKLDLHSGLALTTAVYRLDRTNTRSTDPNDPTRIVQTGSQRTNGYELGLNGRVAPGWDIAGGYAFQDAFVTSATAAARVGAVVGQVPHHTLSLWNHYRLHPKAAAALGVLYRSDMFAAIDDTVTLPGYVRVDAAGYVSLAPRVRLQVNVENLFDKRYYVNADSNTNISPGFPRTVRVGLTIQP